MAFSTVSPDAARSRLRSLGPPARSAAAPAEGPHAPAPPRDPAFSSPDPVPPSPWSLGPPTGPVLTAPPAASPWDAAPATPTAPVVPIRRGSAPGWAGPPEERSRWVGGVGWDGRAAGSGWSGVRVHPDDLDDGTENDRLHAPRVRGRFDGGRPAVGRGDEGRDDEGPDDDDDRDGGDPDDDRGTGGRWDRGARGDPSWGRERWRGACDRRDHDDGEPDGGGRDRRDSWLRDGVGRADGTPRRPAPRTRADRERDRVPRDPDRWSRDVEERRDGDRDHERGRSGRDRTRTPWGRDQDDRDPESPSSRREVGGRADDRWDDALHDEDCDDAGIDGDEFDDDDGGGGRDAGGRGERRESFRPDRSAWADDSRWSRIAERWLPPSWRAARWDPGRTGALLLALVAVAAAVVAAVAVWSGRPSAEPLAALPVVEAAAGTGSASGTASTVGSSAARVPASAPGAPLVVSVAGRVARPGLLRLPEGARVGDAVEAAGGALPETDLTALNLAARLGDGDQILVGVTPPPGMTSAGGAAASAGSGAGSAGAGSAGSAAAGSALADGPATPGASVNLNSATLEQLDALPGVGPATAKKILDWRTANGRFAAVEQLQDVSGIGEAKFAAMRDLVTV